MRRRLSVVIVLAALFGFAAEAKIVVNEVMASNGKSLSTSDGVAGIDWVELYNSGESPVSLKGWKLTDRPSKPKKADPIEDASEIPARGYLVVFLDKDKTDWAKGVPHAAIGLGGDGDSIALVNPENAVVSRLDFGVQVKDVSVGPGKTPGEIVYFTEPTPGAANGDDGRPGFSPKVSFSERHGYKTAPFSLSLSCDDPGATIRYTLDGSSPTDASPKYVAPILISKTTVVRARAIVPAGPAAPAFERDCSATYLFVEDIVRQGAEAPAGFLPANTANNGQQKIYYGMDTRKFLSADGIHVTNVFKTTVFKGTDRERTFERTYDVTQCLYDGFTNDFRTVSLVIDPKALFDAETGIYNHALKQGDEWERQTMIEQIHPGEETDEFSVACGIRIRGAITRGPGYPKRSFHLSFRGRYGYGKLRHALFGEEGAKEFAKIDLRNDQTAYPGGGNKETMVHELFSRDCQRDLKTTHNRSRYFNLFVNGVYWGLYMYEERVNGDYAEAYNGGSADDYDIVRTHMDDKTNGRMTGVVSGRDDWVRDFWLETTLAQGYGADHPENYNRVRGLNPDGTRNPEYPVYLNVTNLIRYVLVSHYVADTDSPCNSQAAVNNIIAFRNRVDGNGDEDGFLWVRHDAEQSLAFGTEVKWDTANSYAGIDNVNCAQKDNCLFGVFNGSTMLGFKSDNKTVTDKDESRFNPHMLHYRLCDNAEYRMVFADQLYRHLLREGGAMTPTNNYLRYTARMREIRNAMAGETARWCRSGDNYLSWIRTCAANLAFIEIRTPYLLGIYRKHGWYPTVDAPVATIGGRTLMDGALLKDDEKVALSGTGGTIYYTLDGSDPRLAGGARNPSAAAYSAPFPLSAGSVTLHARVLSEKGEWSALEEVSVRRKASGGADPRVALRIAEVMSNSVCADGNANDYLVFTNLASSPVPLANVALVAWNAKKKSEAKPSLTLTFAGDMEIPARGSMKVTAHAFPARGKLTNSDVGLRLYDIADESPVLIQDCFVSGDWFGGVCDGKGASFVANEFGAKVTTADQWRSSLQRSRPKEAKAEPVGDAVVLKGDYTGAQTIASEGGVRRVVLKGARIPGGIVLKGAGRFEFVPEAGAESEVGSIRGPDASLKLDGEGALKIEGPDTLVTISNLVVKSGAFLVRSTGVVADKTPVVKVFGHIKQTGGAIGLDLGSIGPKGQAYGIYLANKNQKGAKTVYGEFGGGDLAVKVGGRKSAAICGEKGSADVTFEAGETVKATLVGEDARLLNVAGKLKFHGGEFTVTAGASARDVRVFKCGREITVKDGFFRVIAPGNGSEIFSSSRNKDGDPSTITISGGTFELESDDDCFNADDNITVSGGLFYAVSRKDDVFDSNGDMVISGGTIVAFGLGSGHEAFDVEPLADGDDGRVHRFTVSGGTILATGGARSLWPSDTVTGDGVNLYSATGLRSAEYSGKYMTIEGEEAGERTAAAVKLPVFSGKTCSLFATTPGMKAGAKPNFTAVQPAARVYSLPLPKPQANE